PDLSHTSWFIMNGMPFYLPKGQIIRNELEAFLREIQKEYNYQEVRTPFMMNQEVWERSGHWGHYKDNMYFSEVDNKSFIYIIDLRHY
ncbi:hypothetical protein ACT453_50740, partial [Bacillus sp. D-CC]